MHSDSSKEFFLNFAFPDSLGKNKTASSQGDQKPSRPDGSPGWMRPRSRYPLSSVRSRWSCRREITKCKTALYIASESGQTDIVQILIDQSKIDLDQGDIWGKTPLTIASENGHQEVVKLLLDHPHFDKYNSSRVTPALHVASENGHAEVVKLIAEHHPQGAD